jgi:MraZ protein
MYGRVENTLDDKGRITFPARFKRDFPDDRVIITLGLDTCLWVYPPEVWREVAESLEQLPMSDEVLKMQRHFLGSAAEAEIDRSGRIAIPQSLREYAGLSRDCLIMAMGRRLEIWDTAAYGAFFGKGDDLKTIVGASGLRF